MGGEKEGGKMVALCVCVGVGVGGGGVQVNLIDHRFRKEKKFFGWLFWECGMILVAS